MDGYMGDNVLAERLKKLRSQRGLFQKEVADKLGIKPNTLSGYENGTRNPDTTILRDIANLYDVTVDYLLGRSDRPKLTAEQSRTLNKEEEEILKLLDQFPEEEQQEL